ncbi:MAG: galactosyltransferase Lgt5, partial [Gammaproteobacteria bacterium]|nr:galactosyltransferase Lgt5 [Gammaproteobacteria bacterium]NIW44708.1 galactosyltransferase Lgt5 [Gammaproteobacteria bacterium]NIW97194.1 galactosyltransferase Lgt5 [Phycisphaerae bacterium]
MLPDIHTLWIEGPLSNLERICLASMLKQGHTVYLHTYGEVTNVPAGVIMKDAADLLEFDASYTHTKKNRANNINLFSDY